MAGQKNGLAESAAKRPEAPVPQAPRGSFSRPGPAIPRRVAPQQSPTPFRQARKAYHSIVTQGAGPSKTGQTRPPAPGTAGQRAHRDSTAPGASRNGFRRPHNPLHQHHPQDIVNRNPTSVHLSVLTRPFAAGSDAPGDNLSRQLGSSGRIAQAAPTAGGSQGFARIRVVCYVGAVPERSEGTHIKTRHRRCQSGSSPKRKTPADHRLHGNGAIRVLV